MMLETQLNSDLAAINSNLTFKTYDYSTHEFNFEWFDYPPGIYRLGTTSYILGFPNGDSSGVAYSNVLIIRASGKDTQTRILFPYGTDRAICYRTGNSTGFSSQAWKEIATK